LRYFAGLTGEQAASARIDLAASLLAAGKADAAEPLLRSALATLRMSDPGGARYAEAESLLGAALTARKQFAEAAPLLTGAYAALTAQPGLISRPRPVSAERNDLALRLLSPESRRIIPTDR
jgi:hypothetical protein